MLVATDGPVLGVYALAILATVAQTLFRPAHSALLPSLCATPAELTSANVVRGLLDSLATLAGPAGAALLLAVAGPGAVLTAVAALSLWATALVARLDYAAPPRLIHGEPAGRATLEGLRVVAHDRRLRILTTLGCAQTFTRGCLSVFVVVVAIDLLGMGEEGVGLLTAAVGGGAVLGSLGVAMLTGHGRLAAWFGAGVALWGAPLAGIALVPEQAAAIALLAIVGIGNVLVDVGAFTRIARLVDDRVMARAFAAVEALFTLGVGMGSALASLAIGALGIRGALAATGALAPIAVVITWRSLRALDAEMRGRDTDIHLLRRLAMLRLLPEATIEQIAAGLERTSAPAGAPVFEQGAVGDRFYVIAAGEAEVVAHGEPIRTLGPGDGFGEIALLRTSRRTATVRAVTALDLRAIRRDHFVPAVTGYPASSAVADRRVDEQLARTERGCAASSRPLACAAGRRHSSGRAAARGAGEPLRLRTRPSP